MKLISTLKSADDEQAARDATIAAIKEILARGHFQKREVISCLPSSELIIKSLRLDTFDDEEIEKTIKVRHGRAFRSQDRNS